MTTQTMTKTTNGPVAQRRVFRPAVDIVEHADRLELVADIPGAEADKIDIHFEKGVLLVHAPAPDRQSPETTFGLREYGIGDFKRAFEVAEAIDAERISAEYRDGVLTVRLPKSEAVKPRKIAVQSE